MKPAEICNAILGAELLAELLASLSAPQIKAVLKEGGLKVKLPGGFVGQEKRRRLWTTKILGSIGEGNDAAASEFLQQWLLHHRREMLIDYLDALGVPHTAGETDKTFLVSSPGEIVREQATKLLERHPHAEAEAYLRYVAFQQKSPVFDDWSPTSEQHASADGAL